MRGDVADAMLSCESTCDGGACVGEQCHRYPQKRVGIFYHVWHAFAWDAVSQRPEGPGPTIDEIIATGGSVDDVLPDADLKAQAQNFHYHVRPALDYYCLYRKRAGDADYAEPNAAPDCPDIESVAETHARQLWSAGVDFVFVDLTNLAGFSPRTDVLGLRPLEVLLEEWAALRARGVMTPQVAAWVQAPEVRGPMVFERVLELYNRPEFAELLLRDDALDKKVLFAVDPRSTAENLATIEDNGGREDVVAVRLWGNLDDASLEAGVASWMQPCEFRGEPSTILRNNALCDQGYSETTPIGTVLSVSTSYQRTYSSLPFRSPGRQDGLTLKRQFSTAFTVQPDYLLINGWNEFIAQPAEQPLPRRAQ